MKDVRIWCLTDNDDGKKLANTIRDLGLTVGLLREKNFKAAGIRYGDINVFIIDLLKKELADIAKLIRSNEQMSEGLKFVFLPKRDIKKAVNVTMSLMHIEFISRPVNQREFVLLLEKSVVVERYREMLKIVSSDAESRINTFQSLMDIGRKDIFESEKEKEAFEKILEYEKHLMDEQARLNMAVREFTLMRQKEMFDIKNRIKAEEMLADLRRIEMMDAQSIIKAQEAVIDFSSRELKEAGRIIDANEKVRELSRAEAIDLHEQIRAEREKNFTLKEEVERLKAELSRYKRS